MKTLKTITACLCLLLFYSNNLQAQQGPVSLGGDASGAGGSASYSVGQIDYVALEGIGGKLGLGLQQAFEIFTNSILEIGALGSSAYVYPNPSSGLVSLHVLNAETSLMRYTIYDMQGKMVQEANLSGSISLIDMNEFANGAYFIRLNYNAIEIKTFKIIKQ